MTSEQQFYAYVEIEEYGEEPREKRIGPFYAESEDALRDTLAERGENVTHIEAAA